MGNVKGAAQRPVAALHRKSQVLRLYNNNG